MKDATQIIIRPLLTEKNTFVTRFNQFVFEVAQDANKIEIRSAVQALFKVTVIGVRTLVVRGKEKRVGRFAGRRPSWKKAFVTLKPGDNIEFFEGV